MASSAGMDTVDCPGVCRETLTPVIRSANSTPAAKLNYALSTGAFDPWHRAGSQGVWRRRRFGFDTKTLIRRSGQEELEAQNDNWEDQLETAYPVAPFAQSVGADAGTGTALLEIYELQASAWR